MDDDAYGAPPPTKPPVNVNKAPPTAPAPARAAAAVAPPPRRGGAGDDDDILDDEGYGSKIPTSTNPNVKPKALPIFSQPSASQASVSLGSPQKQNRPPPETVLKDTVQKFASQASRIPRALAFPPLTVDPLQGLDVLAEALSGFLQKTLGKDPPLKLYLVHAEDAVIQAARLALQQKRVQDRRVELHVGDLAHPHSCPSLQLQVGFLANPTNWRFKASTPLSHQIFTAAGPSLFEETKSKYDVAQPGEVYLVEVPKDSPMRRNEGVVGIFHLLQVQEGSTAEGKETLLATYQALFETFLKAVTPT
jgi:hypothetical protein